MNNIIYEAAAIANKIRMLIKVEDRKAANDLLMIEAELLSRKYKVAYSDAKELIAFTLTKEGEVR